MAMDRVRLMLSTRNQLVREFFAEFFGMFILVFFGTGTVAQHVFTDSSKSTFFTINVAWGIAVALALYVVEGVSAGHINPAVTLAVCISGEFPWKKLPIYFAGQYLGAFVAAAAAFGVYYDALVLFEETNPRAITTTGWIFTTYPAPYLSIPGYLFDQVASTSMMMVFILALTDENNPVRPPRYLLPVAVGMVIALIGMCFGHNCGYPLNPGRDLGPRIFTAMSGWGGEPFSANNYGFWVPIVGPHLGCILGIQFYNLLIGYHLQLAVQTNKVDHMDDSGIEYEKQKQSIITATNEF